MINVRKPMVACMSCEVFPAVDCTGSRRQLRIVPSVENPWNHCQPFYRPKRPNLNRFPVIMYTCWIFRFNQGKVPYDC